MIKKLLRYCVVAIAIFMLVIACNSDTQLNNTQIDKSRSRPKGLAPGGGSRSAYSGDFASSPRSNKVLQIWWDKGYSPEEDAALQKLVKKWSQKTGHKVEIDFYTLDQRSAKPQRYLQGGETPDIFMSFKAESTLNPRLAWEGKLIDLTSIVEPVKAIYEPGALATAYYYNNVEQKYGYYAVPIHRAALHIYYWQDLVEKTGRTAADIPQDWDGFWQFWIDVAKDLKNQHQQNILPIGLPMSVEAGDTYQAFEYILEAYNVKLVDEEGNLLVDDPQVRQGIIQCLD
ncbi:MAG: hypothetical protein RLZZ535_3305, partial [Cyanobacteriota bacterium]